MAVVTDRRPLTRRRPPCVHPLIHPPPPTNPTTQTPQNNKQVRDEIRAKFSISAAALSPSPSTTANDPGFGSLGSASCISYAPIARTADAVRRRGLATMLLDLEPLPASRGGWLVDG